MSRKRKAATIPAALEASLFKRKKVQSTETELSKASTLLADMKKKLEVLTGPENILKSKILKKKIAEQEALIVSLGNSDAKEAERQKMSTLLSQIDRLEKNGSAPISQTDKKIPTTNRLYPPLQTQRNILDEMTTRDSDRWKTLRSFKKRYSVMFNKPLAARKNIVDVCTKCKTERIVDKEASRSVCGHCGDTIIFASHIFEQKENDKEIDSTLVTRQQSLSHMSKFSSQFERGYPVASLDVLEKLCIEYRKFHFQDPSKVLSCRTASLLKSIPSIPKIFRRAPDRLSKELKCESIPEFTSTELNGLLNQRNCLRLPEDKAKGGTGGGRKSYNNTIFIRQFGRSNDLEIARLFQQAKTVKIHIERCRALEEECLFVTNNKQESHSLGFGKWKLKPFS